VSESARAVLIRDATGVQRELKASRIESRVIQKQSLMPDGLVSNLTPEGLADLIAYLQSLTGSGDGQKPLPPTPSPKRRGGAEGSSPLSASGRGAGGRGADQAKQPDSPPAPFDDYQNMLDQLGIKKMRKG